MAQHRPSRLAVAAHRRPLRRRLHPRPSRLAVGARRRPLRLRLNLCPSPARRAAFIIALRESIASRRAHLRPPPRETEADRVTRVGTGASRRQIEGTGCVGSSRRVVELERKLEDLWASIQISDSTQQAAIDGLLASQATIKARMVEILSKYPLDPKSHELQQQILHDVVGRGTCVRVTRLGIGASRRRVEGTACVGSSRRVVELGQEIEDLRAFIEISQSSRQATIDALVASQATIQVQMEEIAAIVQRGHNTYQHHND